MSFVDHALIIKLSTLIVRSTEIDLFMSSLSKSFPNFFFKSCQLAGRSELEVPYFVYGCGSSSRYPKPQGPNIPKQKFQVKSI